MKTKWIATPSTRTIKENLLSYADYDKQLIYLRKALVQLKLFYKNNTSLQRHSINLVKNLSPLSPEKRRIYLALFTLNNSITYCILEIDRIKKQKRLKQIKWLKGEPALDELIRRLIVHKYMLKKYESAFKDLFFIDGKDKKLMFIRKGVYWKKSRRSLLYLIVELAKVHAETNKPVLLFKNNWFWIENIFRDKKGFYSQCLGTSKRLTNIRDKNMLDKIILSVRNT